MCWQKSSRLVPHVQTSATGHQATRETVAHAVPFRDTAIALGLADHHQHATTNMKTLSATGAGADASVDVSIIGDTTATDDWSFQFIAVKDMSWNENLDQIDLKAAILAGSITNCTLDGYSPDMLTHNSTKLFETQAGPPSAKSKTNDFLLNVCTGPQALFETSSPTKDVANDDAIKCPLVQGCLQYAYKMDAAVTMVILSAAVILFLSADTNFWRRSGLAWVARVAMDIQVPVALSRKTGGRPKGLIVALTCVVTMSLVGVANAAPPHACGTGGTMMWKNPWSSLTLSGAGNSEVDGVYEWKPDVEPHTMPHNTLADSRGVWVQKHGTCWIGFQNIPSNPDWRKWAVFCSQGAVYAVHTDGKRNVPPRAQWEVSDWINDGHGVAGADPAPRCTFSPVSSYVIEDWNAHSCSQGSPILTLEDCRKAAGAYLSQCGLVVAEGQDLQSETWGGPQGCHIQRHGGEGGGNFQFNANFEGGAAVRANLFDMTTDCHGRTNVAEIS